MTTGSLLAAFIAFQWALALFRVGHQARLAKKVYGWHHVVGGLGPGLLMLHSTRAGYGYLAILSTCFLINLGLGAFNHHNVPTLRAHKELWVVSHVALSLVVVTLGAYHAWTALWFE